MDTQAVNSAVLPADHGLESKADPAKAGGLVGWLTKAVPTALVVTGLGGLAYWGHKTEWKFVERHAPGKADSVHDQGGLAVVKRAPAGADGTTASAGARGIALVEFASAEAVEKAGIDIAPVWQTAMAEEITASGEVLFDPSLVARLSPRAAGTAWWVAKTAGDTVKVGEVLALIDAADVGKAKAEFQQALVQVRLKRQALANLAAAQGVIPERQRRESEAAVKDAEVRLLGAEQALTNLGLPVRAADFEKLTLEEGVRRMRTIGVAELLRSPEAKGMTANLVPVRAPFEGVALSADVVAGEVVEAGKVLFVVVNPRRLWLTLHVSPDAVRRVALGQPVKFSPDGPPGEFEGRVTWVGTAADETTRTVPVRAELANDAGKLRASTLGKGRIVLRTEPNALVVPNEAVQTFRGEPVVFVRHADYLKADGPKSFEARAVRVGAKDAQNTEVLSGLRMGDVVATKGSVVLLNELERGVGR
ncbi:MAG TPA: efflux RND transporter periplasmic adaptor subunit [Gemmataceae bacterium]|nr:efflux RND transporter periplasmic adaptor subunit [Gemmataceae bacterium]